jgi:hypothetical protein
MKVTQVFRSSKDERVISETEIRGAGATTPIPITGDEVRWIVRDKAYAGVVNGSFLTVRPTRSVLKDRMTSI